MSHGGKRLVSSFEFPLGFTYLLCHLDLYHPFQLLLLCHLDLYRPFQLHLLCHLDLYHPFQLLLLCHLDLYRPFQLHLLSPFLISYNCLQHHQ